MASFLCLLPDGMNVNLIMPRFVDSKYRTAFNSRILELAEQGELEKLKQKWWKNTENQCPVSRHFKLHAGLIFLTIILIFKSILERNYSSWWCETFNAGKCWWRFRRIAWRLCHCLCNGLH